MAEENWKGPVCMGSRLRLQRAEDRLPFILLEHVRRCLLQGWGTNDDGWGDGQGSAFIPQHRDGF